MGHLPDARILVMQHLLVFGQFLLQGPVGAEQLHNFAQVGMSLGQFAVVLLIVEHVGLSQSLFQLHVFLFKAFQFGEHIRSPARRLRKK